MFTHLPSSAKRKGADAIVVPFFEDKSKVHAGFDLNELLKLAHPALSSSDFKAKEGETALLYMNGQPEKRLLLLGLGKKEEINTETLRRAYHAAVVVARKKKWTSLNILLPDLKQMEEGDCFSGIAEGILLTNYSFHSLKKDSIKEETPCLLEKVQIIGGSKEGYQNVVECEKVSQGVYLARDLSNGNADDVTPQYLGSIAKKLAKDYTSVKATVFDKKRIEKEKMGLLLAVNRGSRIDPAFIVVEYKGAPKQKEMTVIVGKGVTYDTGGLNLKPTGYMETMKCDMSGAAVALGTIKAAAAAGLKCNVTAVIPSTENGIDAASYKPGDVYTSYAGKTVEIGNTDAEGRLILADALAWSCKNLKPTRIVDFATLTGAIVIALGEEVAGLMSNNDILAKGLIASGEKTYERVWRMPLFKEYKTHLKSDVADLSNVGGREAGSITAALFLQEFVDNKVPWAHCDIAGVAFLKKGQHYHPKQGTGIGVRLMVEFLKSL